MVALVAALVGGMPMWVAWSSWCTGFVDPEKSLRWTLIAAVRNWCFVLHTMIAVMVRTLREWLLKLAQGK